MKMWLLMVYSFLSYTCDGSSVNQSTHSSVNTAYTGTDITDIKMEVDVMKGNYHDLLLRVIYNEDEIAFLKGQTQHLEHELEKTKRTFSCEINGLRDVSMQYEQILNETINSWNTIYDTIQNLSQSVSVLDNKYSLLETTGSQSNASGDGSECPSDWIRRVDFGACYFFSDTYKSWNDAQEQCRKHKGSLTDIYSEIEAMWLEEYSSNHSAQVLWIGGKNDTGVYKWFNSDGETKHMNYTRWANGRPNQHTAIYRSVCAHLNAGAKYKWFTWNCDARFNFICKIYI